MTCIPFGTQILILLEAVKVIIWGIERKLKEKDKGLVGWGNSFSRNILKLFVRES